MQQSFDQKLADMNDKINGLTGKVSSENSQVNSCDKVHSEMTKTI